MEISIVSPVFNGERTTDELVRRLNSAVQSITADFEIILVDDASSDRTWETIERLSSTDSRVQGIRLSRNSGQHVAITAGLDASIGRWVVVLDCDLQDPPEAIPRLYAEALRGFDVVVASFDDRDESGFERLTSRLFWRTMASLSGLEFDRRHGNFRIMSRRVVDHLGEFNERSRLLGAMTLSLGLPMSEVQVSREDRVAGRSNYTFGKRLRQGLQLVNATSAKPLQVGAATGFAVSALLAAAAAAVWIRALVGGFEVPGWAGIMLSVSAIGAISMFNLGLIGAYLSKVLEQVRLRPLYVVAARTEVSNSGLIAELPQVQHRRIVWITGPPSERLRFARELHAMAEDLGLAVVRLEVDQVVSVFRRATDGQVDLREDTKGIDLCLDLAATLACDGVVIIFTSELGVHDRHITGSSDIGALLEIRVSNDDEVSDSINWTGPEATEIGDPRDPGASWTVVAMDLEALRNEDAALRLLWFSREGTCED